MSFTLSPDELSSPNEVNIIAKMDEVMSNLETRNKMLENAVQQTTNYNKGISEENERYLQTIKDLERILEGQRVEAGQRSETMDRQFL